MDKNKSYKYPVYMKNPLVASKWDGCVFGSELRHKGRRSPDYRVIGVI